MKKLSMYALASAVALALGATAPAMAEDGGDNGGYRHHDPVKAKVRVRKDREVLEAVLKYKGVLVASYGVILPDGAAEADSVVVQKNEFGFVDHNHGVEGDPNPLNLDADIIGSVNDNAGVVQLNQDAGNMVNQGNVAAVAVTGSETSFADANAAAEQKNENNISDTTVPLDIGNLNKDGLIEDSINGNSGIIHVNQNTGDMNNQLNITSAAFGEGAVAALADSELGQFNTGNSVNDTNSQKRDDIFGSVNGNTGIVNVNQSSGKFNNQATVVSFSGSASIN